MTRNYIAITDNKNDRIAKYNDVIAVPASYRQSSIDKGKKWARKGNSKDNHGSGIVLLFLCVLSNNIRLNQVECIGTMMLPQSLSSRNNNIRKSSKAKHFDSLGEYYSFGNKGNFGMVDNSSQVWEFIPQKLTRMWSLKRKPN